ncbi:carboxymuconolactone decarboxylase family protein [Nonomuraea spiralis]|uniref:carboxymuconolactone decarboxylase family protein n=1 Tax=Nonomuraea spiralis TaxID=46182 RepID=UPI00379BBB91
MFDALAADTRGVPAITAFFERLVAAGAAASTPAGAAWSPTPMSGFRTHDESDAPEAARPMLEAAKQVVLITAGVANGCEYCVAAHSTLALRARVPAEVVEALRAGRPLADQALEAVRRLTHAMVVRRGWVDEAEIEAFLAAGRTPVSSRRAGP